MRRGPEFLYLSPDEKMVARNLKEAGLELMNPKDERLLVVENGCLRVFFTKIEAAIGNHRGHKYNAVRIPAGVTFDLGASERGHASMKTRSHWYFWVVGEEAVRAALVHDERTRFNDGGGLARKEAKAKGTAGHG